MGEVEKKNTKEKSQKIIEFIPISTFQ